MTGSPPVLINRSDITISPLSSYPEYAPILAFWSFRQWYISRNIPFEAVLRSYQARSRGDGIPRSFIATIKTLPVGMASIKNDDLWNRKDLNPWLASLYVLPEYRKSGIAELLMKRVIEQAVSLGTGCLHLFLGSGEMETLRGYYVKRGWKFLEKAVDNDGHDTEIYRHELRM